MGWRFRRSFKIAPGVKFNLNKNSTSVTVGKRGLHHTISSTGKHTTSVGIPGTGVSYTHTDSGASSASPSSGNFNSVGSSRNKNGCVGCLTYFVVFSLFCIFIKYAWGAGIIALIYYVRKPATKGVKTRRIVLSVLAILTSLFANLLAWADTPLTAINAQWERTEYDINDTTELELELTPSDGYIYSLELADNDIAKLIYSDDRAVVSFIGEGTGDIVVIANDDIKSKPVTITVVDYEAEKEREQARAEAEEAEREEEKTEEVAKEETVWVSSSGSCYHCKSDCGRMNPDKATEMTQSQAESNGYKRCQRCY